MRSHKISCGFGEKIIRLSMAIFIVFCIYSCKKEDTSKEPECLLKRCEIITNWNSGEQTDTVIWTFDYNTEGLLTKYTTQNYSSNGNDYDNEYFFTYDENEKVERIDQSYGGGAFAWFFTWNQNKATMEQWYDTGDSLAFDQRKFIFEFNSRNELVKLSDYNGIETPEDEDPVFWEYWNFYYSSGNMIKVDDFSYDSLWKTTTYTYDNKKNPLSEQHLGWFFDFDLFISRNNILSEESFNYYLNQVTTTKNMTYEYNEYGYPVEMISSQISPSFTKDETWKFEYLCDSI